MKSLIYKLPIYNGCDTYYHGRDSGLYYDKYDNYTLPAVKIQHNDVNASLYNYVTSSPIWCIDRIKEGVGRIIRS